MSRLVRRGVIAVQLLFALLVFLALPFTSGGRRTAPVNAQSNGVCQANPSPPDSNDPSIVVAAPTSGDRVANPLTVSGYARVFEGTVSLSLKGADGTSIADGTAQAAEGAPALAAFSGTLPFSISANMPACLWVYEASARDGSPVNVVQVPVMLLARAGGIASGPPPPSASTSTAATPAPTSIAATPAPTSIAATPAPTGTPTPSRTAAASATVSATATAAANATAGPATASPSSTPRPGSSATPTPGRQVAGTPLRRVDWITVLGNDPYIGSASGCFPPPGAEGFPCVTILLSHPQTMSGPGGPTSADQITGYADVSSGDVIYGDIDGDGADEAAILIQSGGTAGAVGLLVYHQASPAPQIVDVIPGYKLGASIASGALVVAEPFYFGFEANCCPTGLVQTSFTEVGDNLQVAAGPSFLTAGQDSHPVTPAELTVLGYYHAIDAGSYKDAYALTSPAYQAANPYDAWQAGFATTKGVAAQTQPGTNNPNSVLVNLTVQEQTDAGATTRNFAGTWTLIPSDSAPLGLLLDHADITEVSTGQ
jgi:hypothetical protein